MEPILDAWRKNCAINLFLLDHVRDDQLDYSLPKSKSIRAQFAHMVNVRRMKIKMCARELLDSDDKSDRRKAIRDELRADLISSGEAIEALLTRAESPGDKIKGSPGSVTLSFALLLAHEGNHRGQIEAALRVGGAELPVEAQIRMWEWSKF